MPYWPFLVIGVLPLIGMVHQRWGFDVLLWMLAACAAIVLCAAAMLPARIPDFNNHSWREYGHRVGIWRLYDIFDEAKVPASCTVNGILCERHPQIVTAAAKRGWELIAHNYIQTEFMINYRDDRAKDFQRRYRDIDVLLVDDIQFLAGKVQTLEEFFHTFNTLHNANKQIVVTSDLPPKQLQDFEDRMRSRFEWGLITDVQPPDLETRIAILNRKMYQDGIELPKEIVEYIAYSITSNIRELEGALISILAQASMNRRAVTLELAKQMIDKYVKNTTHEVSIDYIQKVVCDYFDLPIEMLKSKTRKRQVVQARQIAMYFAKSMTKSSLSSIGAHCGGKDHATVLHACRTVNNLIETDKKFKASVQELQKKISINAK